MSAFIAALLAVLGPLIGELLMNWLKSIFNKAAKRLEGRSFGSPAAQAVALCDEAIAICPKAAVGKRVLLRFIRNHAASIANGFPLTSEALGEIGDAAKIAK